MPAPRREAPPAFPRRWMYVLGLAMMIVGVVVAIVGTVNAFRSLSDDVDELRRTVGAGAMIVGLDRGEYFVYDEDGFEIGPFDVRVERVADGAEVATREVVDGTTYDVDGRSGRAKISFTVPTDALYRVEVKTGPGSLARFALGSEVSSLRDRLLPALLGGIALVVLGLVVVVWTGFAHARWRLRYVAGERISQAREAVGRAAGNIESVRESASSRVGASAERARSAIGEARAAVEGLGSGSGATGSGEELPSPPPAWRAKAAGSAERLLERAETALGSAETTVAEALERVDAAALADSVESEMARMEEGLAAGEPLGDLARGGLERTRSTASEIGDLVRATASEARAEAAATVDDARRALRSEVDAARGASVDVAAPSAADADEALEEACEPARAFAPESDSAFDDTNLAEREEGVLGAGGGSALAAGSVVGRFSVDDERADSPAPVAVAPAPSEQLSRPVTLAVPAVQAVLSASESALGAAPVTVHSTALLAPAPDYVPLAVQLLDDSTAPSGEIAGWIGRLGIEGE